MLDTDTKRRIDTARDILVGKVPDPKSQVEQITIALIYKFMDDMDAESEEFGGKRKFFADAFARYGWAKLMRSGLGGHETLNLYAEAIARMPENPGIPPLFRDIFKNAYLPYRDPETLKMFLKVIDEFNYDHSERLGDAFEYLLSVLGSQGDAGQFRTPRHIIDFMVEIIDPKKTETVLDPACGTAGFLISSYKHILKANTDAKGNTTLTPDDKGRLAKNFKGYDISPDMVRLSLVNLYLHGFADPHIAEYDTLTSQDKWNEYADVILANPPFMSPKGGIKPHNRFSVQSKRSEVLFVDYMAEHLTPTGRAGIIVPEGIIFQSQTAYKQLRKMLVEDCLGAQRREIDKNDLPQAVAEIGEYLHRLRAGESVADFQPTLGLIVAKEKIAANGDYSLSGERYRASSQSKRRFPLVELGTICKPEYGFTATAAEKGDVRFVRITDIAPDGRLRKEDPKYISLTRDSEQYLLKKGDLLVARTGATFGKTMLFDEDYPAVFASYLIRLRFPQDRLLPEFYWAFAQTEKYWEQARALVTGGGQPQFNGNALTQLQIPLPPLEVQQEIVAEIEGYQKVIDGARAVLDNYHPHITIHPDWPMVTLDTVIEGKPKNGYSGKPVDRTTDTKVLTLSATTSGKLDLTKFKYLDESIPADAPCRCRRGDIYLQRGNTADLVGTAALFDVEESNFIYPDLMIRVRANESKINDYYLLLTLQSQPVRKFLMRNAVGAAGSMPKINQNIVERIPIPLPPLLVQQAIVAEIEAEQALVAANRELIVRFEKKIQATLARVWGEEEATPLKES